MVDLRGAPAPPCSFFGNFGQNRMLAHPPGGLAYPPIGNPGSAP